MSNFLSGFKQIKILQLFILSGGAGTIYFLPYMRSSYYDVMIEGLKLTNTQLGQISSMYGIFTILCYLPGGWLPDFTSLLILHVFLA